MCLEEYAESLVKERNEQNMLYIIQFIASELIEPFADYRFDYPTKSDPEEIFYALTEESPVSLREESLVTVKVFSIDDRQLKVLTNNGVMGVV